MNALHIAITESSHLPERALLRVIDAADDHVIHAQTGHGASCLHLALSSFCPGPRTGACMDAAASQVGSISMRVLNKVFGKSGIDLTRLVTASKMTAGTQGDADANDAPGPSDAIGRLTVGTKVKLSEGYKGIGDAAHGPLKPDDVGTIKLDQGPDHSSPYKVVSGSGTEWWYREGALVRSEREECSETVVHQQAVELPCHALALHMALRNAERVPRRVLAKLMEPALCDTKMLSMQDGDGFTALHHAIANIAHVPKAIIVQLIVRGGSAALGKLRGERTLLGHELNDSDARGTKHVKYKATQVAGILEGGAAGSADSGGSSCNRGVAFTSAAARQPQNPTPRHAPLFQNGAKSGFEMCFDTGSQHLGCWGQNTSRIQDKDIYATLRLQATMLNHTAIILTPCPYDPIRWPHC